MRRGHVVYRLQSCYVLHTASSRDASLGIFTVAFGVVYVDEIAQDSARARAYRKGRYSRVVGFVFVSSTPQSLETCASKTAKCGHKTRRCSVVALDHRNIVFF